MHRFAAGIVTLDEHLSATDIAAFIDRSLSLGDRAHAELHLSDCERCRAELAACVRLAAAAPTAQRRRSTWPIVGVAAAVVMLAVVLRPASTLNNGESSQSRTAVDGRASMSTVFPRRDAEVTRSELRFVWRRDDRSSGYRVIVADEAGAPMWTEDAGDTSVAPPLSLPLKGGARYYWRVEALHADGSVAQSLETPFRIRPE
jgi:hypothetical protein